MTYGIQTAFEGLYHKRTAHTTSQAGGVSAGDSIVISGSEATYSPSASASKVVYEINYYAEKDAGIHSLTVALQHYSSGSWSTIDSSYLRTYLISGSAAQSCRLNMHHRWVIPAWTGDKNLRAVMGTRWNNAQVTLHQLTKWDGSDSSTDFADTTLIIYSV